MAKDTKKRHIVTPNQAKSSSASNGLDTGVRNGNANYTDVSREPSSVIEERLRRLENVQLSHNNSSSSDVYKFAFFFLMGIALTVLVYPQISTTLENAGIVPKRSGVDTNKEQHVNSVKDKVDDKVALTDRDSDDDTFEERQEHKIRRQILPNDSREDANSADQSRRTLRSSDASGESGGNDYTDENDLMKQPSDLTGETSKVSSRNDPMIDEDDDESVMISLDDEPEDDINDNNGDELKEIYKEIPVKFENGEGWTDGRNEVKLSKVEVDDSQDESYPKTSRNKETDNVATKTTKKDSTKVPSNTNSKADTKPISKSQTKSNKSKARGKEVKKGSAEQTSPASDDPKNLPAEIKNFKPTYQKTVTPKKVFIDGRRIPPMELLPQKPNNSSVKVWLFEEFLSEQECDGLRRVHNKHVEEQSKDEPIMCFDSVTTLRKHLKNVGKNVNVTPRDFTPGTTCVNETFSGRLKQWLNGNWSYSTAFYPGESVFATAFENRVQQAMGLNPKNGGKFQITSYPLGIGYKSHTDCTENTSDKRDRVATVLVYLDTVEEGGETDFPELGIWARPRKGRALLFTSMSPEGECEPMSIHKANKVLKGHKYILQRWYYYQSFYSLGKRPPEPPLPTRKPGQPRVSCDEYEHGSCRWYDEWNFEHMIEYERRKYQLV